MIKFIIADTRGIYLEDKSFIAHYINVFNSLSTIISKSFSNYEIVFAGVSKYKEIIDNTNFLCLPYSIEEKHDKNLFFRLKRGYVELKNNKFLFTNKEKGIFILQSSSFLIQLLSLAFSKKKYFLNKKILIIIYKNPFKDKSFIKRTLSKFLYFLTKNKIAYFLVSTELLKNEIGENSILLPDYFIERSNKSEIVKKEFDFGIFGYINPDKGCEEIIHFAKKYNYKLLIAGKFYQKEYFEHLKTVVNNSKNIKIINKFMSQKEYEQYLNSCKFITFNYKIDYNRSSGVFYEALKYNIPIIARKSYFFKVVDEFNLGVTFNEVSEIDRKLKNFNYSNVQNNIENYIVNKNKHYIEHFKTKISEIINQ